MTTQTTKTKINQHSIISLNAPLHFLAADNTSLPSKYFTKQILVYLPYIPGGLFGSPGLQKMYSGVLPRGLALNLDLHKIANDMNKLAEPLLARWQQQGLVITPADTRLLRVGTFAIDLNSRKPLGVVGFINPKTKNYLILVYVDKACWIKGDLFFAGRRFNHDIHLPSAGFHYINIVPVNDGYDKLIYYPKGGKVHLSIKVKGQVQAI